jgi:hypothetical protein
MAMVSLESIAARSAMLICAPSGIGEALQARVTDRCRLDGWHRVGVSDVKQWIVRVIQDPHPQLAIARGRCGDERHADRGEACPPDIA